MSRRKYRVDIVVNHLRINKVVIDSHYEEKHSDSMSDFLIIQLVKSLNGRFYEPVSSKEEFIYFVTDNIEHLQRFYRLIWLLEENENYIGVINAFRRK